MRTKLVAGNWKMNKPNTNKLKKGGNSEVLEVTKVREDVQLNVNG